MQLKSFILSMLLLVSMNVFAGDAIRIYTFHPPGGATTLLIDSLAPYFTTKGKSIEIVYTKTCAEAMQGAKANGYLFMNSVWYDTSSNGTCQDFNINDSSLKFLITVTTPTYLCRVNTDITLSTLKEHKFLSGITPSIALERSFAYSLSKVGIEKDKYKVVKYVGGAAFMTALKSNDIQVAWMSFGIQDLTTNNLCLLATGKNPYNVPTVQEVSKDPTVVDHHVSIIIAGLNPSKDDQLFVEAAKSEKFVQHAKKFGYQIEYDLVKARAQYVPILK